MNRKTSLDELCAVVQQFVTERKWDHYHTPKNLAMSIAIEAAELTRFSEQLSPAVEAAIPAAIAEIERLLRT